MGWLMPHRAGSFLQRIPRRVWHIASIVLALTSVLLLVAALIANLQKPYVVALLSVGFVTAAFGSNALCKLCMQEVKLKMFFAIKRRWTAAGPDNSLRTFKRMADAQRMLGDLLALCPNRPKAINLG